MMPLLIAFAYRNHVNISISALIALYARLLIRNVQCILLNMGTLELVFAVAIGKEKTSSRVCFFKSKS